MNPQDSNKVTAGKPLPTGDTAKECLQEPPKPPTPPEVRKFRHSNQPEPGAIRVHHGKAYDPDVASALIHGISPKDSLSSSSLINPPQLTLFQDKLKELGEDVYASRQKAPLGRSHDQHKGLPTGFNQQTIFGVKTTQEFDVRELLNPSKAKMELKQEDLEAHKLYVNSHSTYFVGERINRRYDWPHFRKESVFGLPTPHFDDGRELAKTLHWLDQTEEAEPALNSSLDHTYGILLPPDEYGAGEVIHRTKPGQYTRGQDPKRSLVNAVRHYLKKVNYHHFPSLLQAFRHYDKKGKGLIDMDDLEKVCHEFQLDTSATVLQDLMDDCDVDKDGHINLQEFANFLCWKDRMPIKSQSDLSVITGESEPRSSKNKPSFEKDFTYTKPLLSHEDLEPLEPGSSLRVPRTLRRTRADSDAFTPTSTLIGAVRDSTGIKEARPCGIPSVRSDLPAPRLKRVSDTINYGDTSTAADLLRPSVHAAFGVHEEHFLSPRSKQEIAEIFRNVGVNISQETFEEAWELATLRHPAGEVCVEHFRNLLKEIKAM